MALVEDDVKQAIIDSVGDVDPTTGDAPTDAEDGVIALSIDVWWEMFASKDTVGPGLRMAYVRREAIRRVLAVLAQKRFDVADNLSGLSIRAGQIYKHYQDMLTEANEEIKATEGSVTRGGSPAVGRLEPLFIPAPGDRVQEYIDNYTESYLAATED